MSSEAGARSGLDPAAVAVRAELRSQCAARARWLRVVAEATSGWESAWAAEERGRGALLPRPLRYTPDQIHSLAVDEVCVLTGLTRWAAERLVHEARTLTVMPDVLVALATGRLDPDRVCFLVRATTALSPEAATAVADTVLATDTARLRTLGIPPSEAGVWDLATPQAWRQRVTRTVARVRSDDAQAHAVVPSLYVRIEDATHADLVFTGSTEDVLRLKATLEDLAATLPTDLAGPDGRLLRAGEREAAALLRLCDHASGPDDVPVPAARPRGIGIVLHADTYLGDGPAAYDPGEVRGTSTPVPVPAADARALARSAAAAGAGTHLLLADEHGHLVRMLRLGPAPTGGWTRQKLVTAGHRALADAPGLHTSTHDPTVAIDEHVRAAQPVSVAPATGAATGSGSSRIDLDHRIPHPRGPTHPDNLQPLHRTPHRHKTRGTWHCHPPTTDTPAGHVTWTTRTGATWTHHPEPLPGHAPGEAYAAMP